MNNQAQTAAVGLELIDFSVALDDHPLFNISTSVAPGEILSVMGASGTGKSTLIASIAGFLAPAFRVSGQANLNGQALNPLPTHKRGLGVLFQDPLLFPHLSVAQNIQFALTPEIKGRERQNHIHKSLEAVGLAGFHDRDPATLSGGQQARVALVRTLAAQPRALLLDEPFSKLDAPLRASMRKLVFDEIKHRALPTLMVTHDIADAEAAEGPILRL